jgi:hypothetical protein
MLDVRGACGDGADCRRVCETAPRCYEPDDRQPATDLEAPVVDVAMRDAIAGEMERNAEERRSRPRAHRRSHRRTCRCV